jgi:hypothetical protein
VTASQHSAARVGLRLRRWTEQHCSPDVVDTLVLPILADLQYEDAAAQGNAVVRRFLRVRAYVGLAKALGLHYAIHGRFRMKDSNVSPRPKVIDYVRVGLMIPAALIAAAAVEVLVLRGMASCWRSAAPTEARCSRLSMPSRFGSPRRSWPPRLSQHCFGSLLRHAGRPSASVRVVPSSSGVAS